MVEQSTDRTLEERKLALDEERLAREKRQSEIDNGFRERELVLKEKESGWASRFFSPLTTTLLAGILTLAGSVAGTLLQGRQTLKLEEAKFQTTRNLEREKFTFSKEIDTQRQQHDLVLKMIGVSSVEQSKQNLTFLANTGLISDQLAARIKAAIEVVPPRIPPSTPTSGTFRAVPTTTPGKFIICSFNDRTGSYDSNCHSSE